MKVNGTVVKANKEKNRTDRPYHGVEYAMKVKRDAKITPRRTYRLQWSVKEKEASTLPSRNVGDKFCFNYSEDDWFANKSWESVKNKVLKDASLEQACQATP